MFASRLVLLNLVERAGNAAVLPPVDGEGVPRRHLLCGGESRPFDLGSALCHVLSPLLHRVSRPSRLRQLYLDV